MGTIAHNTFFFSSSCSHPPISANGWICSSFCPIHKCALLTSGKAKLFQANDLSWHFFSRSHWSGKLKWTAQSNSCWAWSLISRRVFSGRGENWVNDFGTIPPQSFTIQCPCFLEFGGYSSQLFPLSLYLFFILEFTCLFPPSDTVGAVLLQQFILLTAFSWSRRHFFFFFFQREIAWIACVFPKHGVKLNIHKWTLSWYLTFFLEGIYRVRKEKKWIDHSRPCSPRK